MVGQILNIILIPNSYSSLSSNFVVFTEKKKAKKKKINNDQPGGLEDVLSQQNTFSVFTFDLTLSNQKHLVVISNL